jgi:hypothetical protein
MHATARLDLGKAMRNQQTSKTPAQSRLLVTADVDIEDSLGDLVLSSIHDQGSPIGLEECHPAPWAKDPCHFTYGSIGVIYVLERALAATRVECCARERQPGCICPLKADVLAMTVALLCLFDHLCREIDTHGTALGFGKVRHGDDVLSGPASDVERPHPRLKGQDVQAPALGIHDEGGPASVIEVIDEHAAGSRGVNVTECGTNAWQIRHVGILPEPGDCR